MSSCEKVFPVLRWRSRPGDEDNELDAAKRDAPKARQFPAWCAEESVSQFDFVRSLLVTLSGSYSFWCMCGAHYCALSGRSQLVRKEFEMYFRTSESSQWERKKEILQEASSVINCRACNAWYHIHMRFLNDSTLARCNLVGAKAKVEIVTLHNFDLGRVEQKWKNGGKCETIRYYYRCGELVWSARVLLPARRCACLRARCWFKNGLTTLESTVSHHTRYRKVSLMCAGAGRAKLRVSWRLSRSLALVDIGVLLAELQAQSGKS